MLHSSSRRSWLLLVIASALVSGTSRQGMAETPPLDSPSLNSRSGLAASFRYVGGEKEKQAIEGAIDRTLDGMFFAIKPIARAKLRQGTVLIPSLSFAFRDGKIQSSSPGNPDIISPETGEVIMYKAADGTIYRTSQRWAGVKLVQQFVAEDGIRKNEYAMGTDGKVMTLVVTVTSSKLPRPLTYRLTYQKQEGTH